MAFNKQKLRAIIVENNENEGLLAEYLKIAPQTFSAKINEKNGASFTYSELCKIIEKYKINKETVIDIFFNNLVS